MKEQKIILGQEVRDKLLDGAKLLADVVTSTLGPSGHSVILDLGQSNPTSTKDGVTVAKAVHSDDPIVNTGVQMVKQASTKTGDEAGDGTTTATLLTYSILKHGAVKEGYNSVEVKKGIDAAVRDITNYIKDNISKPVTGVEQLKQVATISANGDEEIGKLVSKALDKVGTDGAVTVEESKTGESYLDIVEGIQFDRGFKSPYFSTDENTMTAVLRDTLVLIADKRLDTVKELLPALDYVLQAERSLLIIAEDFGTEVLSTLLINKARTGFRVCAVKAPEFGDRRKEVLADIACLTGGQVISPEKGMKLDKFDTGWFGQADKVTVSRDKTTIIGAKGSQESIEERIGNIQNQIETAQSLYDKEQLQARLARMTGGVAIIFVGGHTEVELKERKDRVDDALRATKAALEEGVCPGGGIALLRAMCEIYQRDGWFGVTKNFPEGYSDYSVGYKATLDACLEPFNQILTNVGYSEEKIEQLRSYWLRKLEPNEETSSLWEGWNIKTEKWTDMYELGIIDPTKVIRLALKNAASVAGTMLTSEAMVVNVPDKDEQKQMIPGMY